VPAPSQSLSAVVVSGGKQYRVALGDRIVVDRLAAEPGSELTLDRVLLVADGDDVKVGAPAVEGLTVTARVLGDRRGRKIDVLRYKSKKHVRVHRGARADLTALEILTIAGQGVAAPEKAAAKAERPAGRSRAKAAPKAQVAEPEVVEAEAVAPVEAEAEVEAPKPARRPRAKAQPKAKTADAEPEEDTGDGA
jgi:large subunit ribosomal protein L21